MKGRWLLRIPMKGRVAFIVVSSCSATSHAQAVQTEDIVCLRDWIQEYDGNTFNARTLDIMTTDAYTTANTSDEGNKELMRA